MIKVEEAIDNLKNQILRFEKGTEPYLALQMAIEALKKCAQPEIVRCQDCKHREAETGFCEGRGWPMQLVPDDGFCDKGEKRKE